MKFSAKFITAALAAGLVAPVAAQVTFDFESVDQLDGNPAVSGDVSFWTESALHNNTSGGVQSLRFDGSAVEPFRSFTYDLPIAIDEGTISVWFYDTVGQGAGIFQWGGSVILEDANNPSDFVAVEINDLPYAGPPGALPYHASEGSVDRGIMGDKYDSNSLAVRSVGWHEIVFTITPTETTVSVDGTGPADEVAGPGSSTADLRLRFMADSASAGGMSGQTWVTATTGYPAAPGAVFFDNVTFTATSPAAVTDVLDFEDTDVSGPGNGSGDPEYDRRAEFMVSAAYNEPNMLGFVNTFAPTTAQAQSGTNSIAFTGNTPAFRSMVIDLSGAQPGTITIPFYDALGDNQDFDKVGAAFIIEDGSDPSTFIAAEIWNAEYPLFSPEVNYYFTARPIPFGSGFYSRYFGQRSVGWQTLEIELTNTYSRMTINGIGADRTNADTVYDGPGLNSSPVLRIMADSPTLGGFLNWQDSATWTDPASPELDAIYFDATADYLFLDDVAVPLPAAANVSNWMSYE